MTDDNPQVDEPADPGGTAPFAALYDRAVESLLDVPVREEYLETERGRTHLLTAGNQSAPPVVVFQGGNVTNPVTLSWVQGLADEYHLIAPDTPGQPGKTTVEEPRKFASWVVGLLDGLDLEDPAMIGISHGAGIVLEAAAEVPGRIDAAALVVPVGFGTSVSVEFMRMASPSLAYRFLPGQGFLRRGLAPMFTQPMSTVDGAIIETVETVLRTGNLTSEFPGPDDPAALEGFGSPTLVVTAERDPFFPGKRTCKRASRNLRSLEECLVLADERHFLSPAGQDRATERTRELLAASGHGTR